MSSSEEPINVDDPEIDGDLSGRITYRGELFTGQTVEYHPKTGQRIGLTTYTDGVEDGPSKSWYPDGSLESEGVVKSGSAVGEWHEYHPNGRVRQLDVFDDQGRHQSRKIWDENGTLIEEHPTSLGHTLGG
ncbi:MAG TPA: hypothetical protein VG756_05945 [Pseudonocardiaceae bacterium]|jgi:antitoxin component YwqK of YwqJK toxin-antitoxin module|nr:hypothetical protein [Pseudonocardiaceae bacterium]